MFTVISIWLLSLITAELNPVVYLHMTIGFALAMMLDIAVIAVLWRMG